MDRLNNEFAAACLAGDEPTITRLIDDGAIGIAVQPADDWITGFDNACRGGHPAVVQSMMDRGVTDYAEGLSIACRYGHESIIRLMQANGATYDSYCLVEACRGGHLAVVESILATGINPNNGLQAAVSRGYEPLVNLLLSKCAMPNFEAGLAAACGTGNRKMIDRMIANGANNWNRGLESACIGGHLEIVNDMVRRGANDWHSAFGAACQGGNETILQIIQSKTAVDLNYGLRKACNYGNLYMARQLVDRGAIGMAGQAANDWNGALSAICWSNHHAELIQFLIDRGANDWNRFLTIAIGSGNDRMVRRCIDNGATNLDDGLRSAMYSRRKNLTILADLITAGADNVNTVFDGRRDADLLRKLLQTTSVRRSMLADVPNIAEFVFGPADRIVADVRKYLELPTVLKTIVVEYFINLS